MTLVRVPSRDSSRMRLVVRDLPSVAHAPPEKPHVLLGDRADALRSRGEHLVSEGGRHPPRVILRGRNVLEDPIDWLINRSASLYVHALRLLPLVAGNVYDGMRRWFHKCHHVISNCNGFTNAPARCSCPLR